MELILYNAFLLAQLIVTLAHNKLANVHCVTNGYSGKVAGKGLQYSGDALSFVVPFAACGLAQASLNILSELSCLRVLTC